MNKLLHFNFTVIILASFGAFLLQLFFPQILGHSTSFGFSPDWQREISFWNLAILPIFVAILVKYDYFFLKVCVSSCIIAGLGFGSNHLLGWLENPSSGGNLLGCLENYTFVFLWIIGLIIERKAHKNPLT